MELDETYALVTRGRASLPGDLSITDY